MAENELKPCQCRSAVELCRGDDDYYIIFAVSLILMRMGKHWPVKMDMGI